MEATKTMAIWSTFICIAIQPAFARRQDDGEKKCGADGYMMTYDSRSNSWQSSMIICKQPNPNAYSSNPRDGDKKCSPDGYVMTYDGHMHSWHSSMIKCAS